MESLSELSQADVPEPVVAKGPRRNVLTDLYLHTGAALLRKLVWYMSAGDGKDFDHITTVATPGLGTGRVRIAICKPHTAGSISSRQRKPMLLVLEGGGFILGQPEDGQKHDRRLADEVRSLLPCRTEVLVHHNPSAGHGKRVLANRRKQLDAIVISVDYAKAPKYPYPNALLQAYAVLQWAFSPEAEHLDIHADRRRVAIMGNSAGGNLTAVLSLLLTFSQGPCARFRHGLPSNFRQVAQILLYPSTSQHRLYSARYQGTDEKARSRSLPVGVCELMEDSYLPPYIPRDQMFVAPLTTPNDLLEELQPAPALVLMAGLDCLKDEAASYAEKLRTAGVVVDTHEYAEAIHGFSHYTKGDDFRKEDVDDCWRRISETLRSAFLVE